MTRALVDMERNVRAQSTPEDVKHMFINKILLYNTNFLWYNIYKKIKVRFKVLWIIFLL
jgi:hypothetical protein